MNQISEANTIELENPNANDEAVDSKVQIRGKLIRVR